MDSMDIDENLRCDENIEFASYVPDNSPSTSNLSRDDVLEKICIMLQTEKSYQPNPTYMEDVQAGNLKSSWRIRVAEWLMAVSFH